MKRRQGFTLIELLVVIAILAIIASLLLPALSRAKESARSILCLDNQKQLFLAWYLYGDDHSKFPSNLDFGGSHAPDATNWVTGGMSYETVIQAQPLSDATNTLILKDTQKTLLARYLKTHQVFRCPADKSYAVRPTASGAKYPRARSYSMSSYIGETTRRPGLQEQYFYQTSDFSVASPSQIFIFLDEHEDSINDGYFFMSEDRSVDWGWNDVPASRHSHGIQLNFADGHTERHRWNDKRTVQLIIRQRIYALNQPNNPDVKWLHDHATIAK
jgi:prepilin-type N-terminal cleavage/methylation domain-containing protein